MGLRTALGFKAKRPIIQPLTESRPVEDLESEAILQNCVVLSHRDELLRHMPNNGVAAEVGVASGDFSSQILKINNPRRLHLVDCWRSSRYADGRQEVMSRFAPQIADETVVIHQGFSTEVLPTFAKKSLDWIYIDTSHDFLTTLRELQMSESLIKEGGRISGHDFCGKQGYGVIPAVYKFCTDAGWFLEFIALDVGGHFSFCLRKDPN